VIRMARALFHCKLSLNGLQNHHGTAAKCSLQFRETMMTRNKPHTHKHSHAHGEDHHHASGDLSFDEKMIKLLEHWVKHNDDHADTYRQWAEKANDMKMADVGRLIAEAAEMTMTIRQKIEEAIERVKNRPDR
jgi:hypothetical protein